MITTLTSTTTTTTTTTVLTPVSSSSAAVPTTPDTKRQRRRRRAPRAPPRSPSLPSLSPTTPAKETRTAPINNIHNIDSDSTSTCNEVNNCVMFNIKILLLCIIISYLNESLFLQESQLPTVNANVDINIDMGTCARRSLIDFEYLVHRRRQDEIFKELESPLFSLYSSSTSSASSSSSSSSVPLEERKTQTRPQHEQAVEEENESTARTAVPRNQTHTVFYYYPSIEIGAEHSLLSNAPSSSPSSPLLSVFLQLHDQFQLFYNANTRARSKSHQEHQQQQDLPTKHQNRTLPQHVLLSLPYHYDITKSTEENYAASTRTSSSSPPPPSSTMDPQQHEPTKDHSIDFFGQYKDIRSTLDYNYHSNYIPSRQLLQDQIIQYILNKNNCCHEATTATPNQGNGHGSAATSSSTSSNSPKSSPWIVFTAGAMGAGKSYTMRHLDNTERFPLSDFITIDPDEVRHLLPEYQYYIQNQTSTQSTASLMQYAGAYTKKESGYICEIILQVALRNGCNVLMDGSLRDYQWYLKHFQSLRDQYQHQYQYDYHPAEGSGNGSKSGINIGIIHVRAPKEAILERARLRSKITKRIVPTHVLEESIDMVPKSVAILSQHVDFFVELYNGPEASDIEIMTEGVTWDTFRSIFYNKSADGAVAAAKRVSKSVSTASTSHVVKTKNETKVSSLSNTSTASSEVTDDGIGSSTTVKTMPSPSSKVPSPGTKVDKELDYQLLRLLSKL
mmetsp:Transcript_17375/g.25958  ORF Transcript_17375/g.25958 Transcript_17375/m.25958 type:complete len:732 (+) Transcript_17375:197-2392(+)